MMRTHFLLACLLLGSSACVKKKIYQTELLARQQANAREEVLQRELADRKKEAAQLIENVGNLNKIIGKQEGDIAQLRSEIVANAQASGQSNAQLLTQKNQLETTLANTETSLAKCTATLQTVATAQQQRADLLAGLQREVAAKFADNQQVVAKLEGETLHLILPDQALFEPNGTAVSKSGKALMDRVAQLLSTRPTLDVDIVSYTDNALPKSAKNLTDTWDWSLLRATTLTRLLVTDFGTNANQVTPVGRGEFYPVTSNETPEGRQQNRRTVVVFYVPLPSIPPAK
jgi:chemotaxis protein MotB